MTQDPHARGGTPIGVMAQMDPWEAKLLRNLRLWCEGPCGQEQVWHSYRTALPDQNARSECHTFEMLLRTLMATAYRPLVRHEVSCSCVGADERVFLHLVRCAADGHLGDAALMASLIAGPSKAEHIAILAGQVGTCMQKIHGAAQEGFALSSADIVRLH